MHRKSSRFLLVAMFAVAPLTAPCENLGIGRAATAEDIAHWDIDVGPDGDGLPEGSGTVSAGRLVYDSQCAACHGENGQRGIDKLAGDGDKTIGNYWPYATTLFDYIRRAMPTASPGTLSDDEVYSVTAYLLYMNALLPADATIDAQSLPQVLMPARDRFVTDDRRGGPEVR